MQSIQKNYYLLSASNDNCQSFFVMNGYYYVPVEKHVTSDKNPNKT